MLEWHSTIKALCEEGGHRFVDTTRTRQCIFLAAYVECFDVTMAADVAGISPLTASTNWLQDAVFKTCFLEAQERVKERVAGEIYRRAVKGIEQGVWHQGKLVGMETRYSDRLLELLAKRVDPSWSDRQQTAKIGAGTETSAAVRRILMDPELRAQAMALAEAAAGPLDVGEAELSAIDAS